MSMENIIKERKNIFFFIKGKKIHYPPWNHVFAFWVCKFLVIKSEIFRQDFNFIRIFSLDSKIYWFDSFRFTLDKLIKGANRFLSSNSNLLLKREGICLIPSHPSRILIRYILI